MRLKVFAAIVLVVAALPIATAHAPSVAGTDSLNAGTAPYAQEEEHATETAEDSRSETDEDSERKSEDYTKLYIDRERGHPEVEPGETATFEITVTNGEDSAVTVDPHLFVSPGSNDRERIQESWISIEGDTTIASDEEQTFTVTVTTPEDAKTGYFRGQIAFTDETVTYPGRPARPIHATGINVEVWREPTVTVVSNTYIRGQIAAGDSVTQQIVVKNTGDQATPVNPQLNGERDRHRSSRSSTIDSGWVDIDAPNQIDPGETATITVTVSVPETVDNGRYRGELDLGLKDSARRERRNHWQEVRMRFEVWSQPDDPYETAFEVSGDAENVSLTLSPRSSYQTFATSGGETSFDVTFVSPSGERFEADRVQLTDRGSVDLGSRSRDNAVERQGEYAVRNVGQQFVYRVDDPEAGTWTVEIMPENTIGFSYEIVRNEALESIRATE